MSNISSDDVGFLNIEYAGQWEERTENSLTGLLISNYVLVDGYTPEKSDLLLLIPDSYPAGGIDMFYFFPHVHRIDGMSIGTLSDEYCFDRSWQRWSRHYEWKPGVHDIATHMAYIKNALLGEFREK